MDNDYKQPDDFVGEWFEDARRSEDLDTGILDMIDQHRTDSELEEGALLESLLQHARKNQRDESAG